MKGSRWIMIQFTLLLFLIVSCKDEKKEMAKNYVESYSKFVDSVLNLKIRTAAINWDTVQSQNDQIKINTEISLNGVTNKEKIETRLNESTLKFEKFKEKVMIEREKTSIKSTKIKLGKQLFGDSFDVKDEQFLWITRKNILTVYEDFLIRADNNRNAYTKEDWKEIELFYNSLDKRRDEIEKQGLSGLESREIALLKSKYTPIFASDKGQVGKIAIENEINAKTN